MNRDQLKRLISAQPFEPFVMHLADGRKVSVPHPDFISLAPAGDTCVVWEKDANAFGIVDLILVTQLKVERNGKAAKSGSGKGGKNKRK